MLSKEHAEKVREQILSQLENLPKEQASSLKERIKKMNSGELEKFIQNQPNQQSGKRQCLFCQIIKGLVDTIKVYEDDKVLAILDIMPAKAGHTIIMPKQHYQFLFQLPDDVLAHLMSITALLEEIIVNETKSNGINIHISQGQSAEQTVPHLAINLIPRKDKDGLNLSWPRKQADKSELEKLAREINKRILNDLEIKGKDKQKMAEKEVKEKVVEKAIKKEKSEIEKILEHVRERLP